jgi:simple sugar transport system ATP-binding protein
MTFLEMKHITKRFHTVVANEDVSLSVEKGEVHALLGENGAGKSTLMNILYGMYDQSEGEIYLRGELVHIKDTKQAIELGIGMVHQHFMLIPALTAIENVILGLKDNKAVLDLNSAAEKFKEMAKRYNMEIDPWIKVEDLSVGQQQRLEILKALYRDADLLILDEPTAVLTPQEVVGLFDMVRKLTSEGKTVIFISHKLAEIMEICDRCTVLRLGRVAATVAIKDVVNKQQLATLMVGKEVELVTKKKDPKIGAEILRVENLCAVNQDKHPVLTDVSFSINAGEILGICGVDGNGVKFHLGVLRTAPGSCSPTTNAS